MLAEAQCWTQSLSLKNLQLREANVDNQISKYRVRWVGREEFCVAFGQEERNSTGKGGNLGRASLSRGSQPQLDIWIPRPPEKTTHKNKTVMPSYPDLISLGWHPGSVWPLFFCKLIDFHLRAALGLQKKWRKTTEFLPTSSYTHTHTHTYTHTDSFHYLYLVLLWHNCYNWWDN